MTDGPVVEWETDAESETDSIAIDSVEGKKIRQAENRALTKRKSEKSNKPSGQ